jgi:hypothetical protein
MFLRHLRGDKDEFIVRGHHSTLFAIGLPGWLSESDICQDMVTTIQVYLGEQLKSMTVPQPIFKKHGRTYSMGSDAPSAITSSEEGDDSKSKAELLAKAIS